MIKGFESTRWFFYLVLYVIFVTALWVWRHLWDADPTLNYFTQGGIPWYLLTMATLGFSVAFVSKVKGGAKVVLPIALFFAIAAGFDANFDDFLSLGRSVAYALFFFAGYFIPIERLPGIVDNLQKKHGLYLLHCYFLSVCLYRYAFCLQS